MLSLRIPDPPATPNGDLWVEVFRRADGIQYCSEDGSATIWLSLVQEGRRRRWEWNSYEEIVGIDLRELRAFWEQGGGDVGFVPPDPVPVRRDVPLSRDERLAVH